MWYGLLRTFEGEDQLVEVTWFGFTPEVKDFGRNYISGFYKVVELEIKIKE